MMAIDLRPIEDSLRPCVRCGGKAVLDGVYSDEIRCDDCGHWTGSDFDSLEEAVAWWNEQPRIDDMQQRIAELEAENATLRQRLAEAGEWAASAMDALALGVELMPLEQLGKWESVGTVQQSYDAMVLGKEADNEQAHDVGVRSSPRRACRRGLLVYPQLPLMGRWLCRRCPGQMK